MVESIQQFVKNKRIVFVGNSVEIMKHKLGETIDSYDIVVRFGRALLATPEQEKSIGSRCDIWATGQFRAPCYNTAKPKFDNGKFKNTKILLNRCRGNFRLKDWILEDRLPDNFPEHTEMYSDEELIDVMKAFGKDLFNPKHDRPSAGFITLLWFINKIKTYKSLDLIGFDFFAKTVSIPGLRDKRGRMSMADPHSWHLPCYIMDKSAHDKDLEQQYVSFLERRGDVNWKVISDIKSNVLEYDGWMKGEKLIKAAPKKSKVSKI
jgi:hypothetical protein|tara:strand:- start:2333 stop:3124 length:792 start_codon:yes stop_codon:yes gene_type:complete